MSENGSSRLHTTLGGLSLRNGLILAAGTCGYVDEMSDVLDLSRVGAVVSKSITREPRGGNEPDRIVGLPTGMLNAIGLANVGIDAFVSDQLVRAPLLDTMLIGSVAGHCIEDYVAVASIMDEHDSIAAIELNVSCPNTDDGLVFGDDAAALGQLVKEVRGAVRRAMLIVKLSPNAASIITMAETAVGAGAEALTIANTIPGLAIDVQTRRPRLSRVVGGYSGPGIHPIAVRMVHEVYRCVCREAGIGIVGLGGIMGWEDAAEFILAGATAVGMGTALYADPARAIGVVEGLDRWVEKQGCTNIGELVGAMRI